MCAAEAAAKLPSMDKTFRAYSLDQRLPSPPDMRDWLPDGDPALFISDVVDELDLSANSDAYEWRDGGERSP